MEHIAEEYASIQNGLDAQEQKYKNQMEQTKVSDNIFKNLTKYRHEEYQYLNLL